VKFFLPLVLVFWSFFVLCVAPFALDRFASWHHRRAAERRNRLETRGPTRRRR